MSFDNQNTDSENSKALGTSTPVEDDVKTVSSKSAQAIAREDQTAKALTVDDNARANVQAGS